MGLAIPWNTLCKNIVPKLGLGVCWINSGGGGCIGSMAVYGRSRR